MAQLSDTSAIHGLIRRARVRIRLQAALEGATTATVLAAACAAISVFLVRIGVVVPDAGIAMLVGSGAIVVIGAVLGATKRLDNERVARRIDRASNLADRLSTAIAFSRDVGKQADGDGVTEDMMRAAIKDGIRAVPRANLRAATPFARPRDLWPALGFLAVAALVSGLALGSRDYVPMLYGAEPHYVPPGGRVAISGVHLTNGVLPPAGAHVELGMPGATRPVVVLDWVATSIDVVIPEDAVLGKQALIVGDSVGHIGSVEIVVVDRKDPRYHKADSVVLDPDERRYVEDLLAQLRDTAKRDKVPDLDEFAKKIEELLKKAENGEITKEQLLDALAKAEDALAKNAEPNQDQVDKKLDDMGKELSKDPLTKPLGDALQKQDLEKAQQELEKLADKLDKKELDQKQKDELAKQLDQVSKQMEKQDQKDDKQQQDKQQQLQKEIEKLQEQQKNAKTEQEKQQLQPRLDEKQRELQKLQREQEQKQQSEQRRALQRLQKDMEKAAENLEQKPQKDGQQQDKDSQEQNEQNEKQASQKLHDAARETGKVDHDKRKQAAQKKMSSQMDDLREAMRRAKQKGNKGPDDPFNRQGKNQDFAQRANGGKGQGQGWKPGQQGQGQGQGQGQQGQNGQHGNGSGNGGDDWGTGHDDNLTGDPTQKTGNDKDQDLQGQQSSTGGSVRETILAAAQKGFASTGYKKVYADYQKVVEEVMRNEKLPSSYKYYVKRYFAKIHPNIVDVTPDSKANP
ncbi:MAG TPA: hypothetical protein VGG28_31335 [Kofleriaceae bacterium]|jgi:hypothetical protein